MVSIDLFAGLGGFSEGARLAGVDVRWAANHWPLAVDCHADNHRATAHACQDLQQANWADVPAHDLLLASPCCHGHSLARGKDRPQHDASRSTAWAVVSCAEYHRPSFIVVENVEEFSTRWALFPVWREALVTLGYSLSMHVLDAADHGVPQNRERLFIVGSRSKSPLALSFEKREHRAICEVIEWHDHRWSPIAKPGRSEATLRRIESGRERFGSRFLAPFYGSGSGTTGRSIARPVGTITTLDRWALIDGDRMRMLQPSELRAAMGFRSTYRLPAVRRDAVKLLGNAVCPPVAADVIGALMKAA